MYTKTLNVVTFRDHNGRLTVFDLRQFERDAEHITLSTGVAADGVSPEGCYVNHTESFGGRFTGFAAMTRDEFAAASEHITLSTGVAADGVSPEGCYVNHGGRFTGV